MAAPLPFRPQKWPPSRGRPSLFLQFGRHRFGRSEVRRPSGQLWHPYRIAAPCPGTDASYGPGGEFRYRWCALAKPMQVEPPAGGITVWSDNRLTACMGYTTSLSARRGVMLHSVFQVAPLFFGEFLPDKLLTSGKYRHTIKSARSCECIHIHLLNISHNQRAYTKNVHIPPTAA